MTADLPQTTDWIECCHMLPDRSGHFLCWDARDQNMWIGAFNDSGGRDTWGEPRPLGWASGCNPTHWAERPEPPHD